MNVLLKHAGGETPLELSDEQYGALVDAVTQQHPAHQIHFEDGSRVVVNTRNLTTIKASPVNLASVTADAPPEDTRTVGQLKEALDAKGVTYDPKANKATLIQLAQDNGA